MVKKEANGFTNYEVTFVISSETSELDVQKTITRLQNQIVQKNGHIFSTDSWGKQRLAYPINKFEFGYYANLVFTYPTADLPEFGNDMKLAPEIIRYLIISLDKEGLRPEELKRVDPFKDQMTPYTATERTPARPYSRPTPAAPVKPAGPQKDEVTRLKELDEKLETLLKDEEV